MSRRIAEISAYGVDLRDQVCFFSHLVLPNHQLFLSAAMANYKRITVRWITYRPIFFFWLQGGLVSVVRVAAFGRPTVQGRLPARSSSLYSSCFIKWKAGIGSVPIFKFCRRPTSYHSLLQHGSCGRQVGADHKKCGKIGQRTRKIGFAIIWGNIADILSLVISRSPSPHPNHWWWAIMLLAKAAKAQDLVPDSPQICGFPRSLLSRSSRMVWTRFVNFGPLPWVIRDQSSYISTRPICSHEKYNDFLRSHLQPTQRISGALASRGDIDPLIKHQTLNSSRDSTGSRGIYRTWRK